MHLGYSLNFLDVKQQRKSCVPQYRRRAQLQNVDYPILHLPSGLLPHDPYLIVRDNRDAQVDIG